MEGNCILSEKKGKTNKKPALERENQILILEAS